MLSRRAALAAGLAAPWALALPVSASATPARPDIRPRAAWATAHPVRGTLVAEDDVRFLLVHHTLTPNTERPDTIAARVRSVYAFHTGQRGWADVAYNFLVDPAGVIWEGRRGSIDGPVRGDATGGSQGFAELACFIGDFTAVAPTAAAMDAMVTLLAWLASRSSIPLDDTTTFTSRGSSRWRKGVTVTTARVAGHRDMSLTDCPGDALYPLVATELLPRASALLIPGGASDAPGADASATPGTTSTAAGTPTPEPGGSPSVPPPTPGASPDIPIGAIVSGAAGVAVLAGGAALLARRSAHQHREQGASEHEGRGQTHEEADERGGESGAGGGGC